MNLPALPRSRRAGDKLTAISIGYLVVTLAAVGVTLFVAWQLEGGGAAVNAMGSQRMCSVHIWSGLASIGCVGRAYQIVRTRG